mgnify:CR=1 FL=1
MTWTYCALYAAAGLTVPAAAHLHNVSDHTVRAWLDGVEIPPQAAIDAVADLLRRIDHTVDETLHLVADQAPDPSGGTVQLGVAVDDAEARTLGWPGAGVHRTVIGQAAAALMHDGYSVDIVPRGSTPESAAAADQHGA